MDEVEGIKVFRLEPEHGGMLDYTPGQSAFLHIIDENGESVVKRPYSIASAPHQPYLEFCIKMVDGEMTGKLAGMEEGDILGVEGPGGHFRLEDEKRAAFICGGTGIAPFMSMLRYIAHLKRKGRFVLFYSARTMDSIAYREELERLGTVDGIGIVFTLTRERPEGWGGEYGRVCESMIMKYIDEPSSFDWWVCGPMAMIRSMKECLGAKGVDPKKVRLEGWG